MPPNPGSGPPEIPLGNGGHFVYVEVDEKLCCKCNPPARGPVEEWHDGKLFWICREAKIAISNDEALQTIEMIRSSVGENTMSGNGTAILGNVLGNIHIYNTPASQPMFQPMPQPPRIPLGLVFQGYSAPVDPEFLVLLRQVERENRTIPMDIIWRHAEIIRLQQENNVRLQQENNVRLQQENNVLRFLFEYFFAGR